MPAKPYYLGDSRWYYLTPTERDERARALADLLSQKSIPELADIEPEDTLDFLRQPDPGAWRDFRCGFEGSCP